MFGSIAEGGGKGSASGLWLEGRLCRMLTAMLGGDLDVRVRVRDRVGRGLGSGTAWAWGGGRDVKVGLGMHPRCMDPQT